MKKTTSDMQYEPGDQAQQEAPSALELAVNSTRAAAGLSLFTSLRCDAHSIHQLPDAVLMILVRLPQNSLDNMVVDVFLAALDTRTLLYTFILSNT